MKFHNKKAPLVSVIVPTYNRYGFLKEALSSVWSQSYESIELIVVDDGSSDGTGEWCRDLKNRNFKYIKISHCGLPGKVRNVGIGASNGDFIAFLDSDDIWETSKIKKQVFLMKDKSNCIISHTRERWIRNGMEVSQSKQRHKREGNIFKDALVKCIIGPSTVMVKRELFDVVGLFNEELEIAEDYELWLRVTSMFDVCYIDKPLTVKRGGHGDQLSEKYGQIEVFRIRALKVFLTWFLNRKDRIDTERKEMVLCETYRELARKCNIYAKGCFKRGKLEEGNRFAMESEKYYGLYRQYCNF